MDLIAKLESRALSFKGTLGIGVGDDAGSLNIVEDSISRAVEQGVRDVRTFTEPTKLVAALETGAVSCAVRGSLPAKSSLAEVAKRFKLSSIYRAALLSINNEHSFFLAPVGIAEGIFIDERLKLIKLISPLLADLSVEPRVGILSGGRIPEDFGRSGLVDESLGAGEKLLKLAKDVKFDAKHYGILIEDAYSEANVIIAPNGIVGNLLFRTLHYLGACRSFGAPVLNLDKTFVDTSRSKSDYYDPMLLACALAQRKK